MNDELNLILFMLSWEISDSEPVGLGKLFSLGVPCDIEPVGIISQLPTLIVGTAGRADLQTVIAECNSLDQVEQQKCMNCRKKKEHNFKMEMKPNQYSFLEFGLIVRGTVGSHRLPAQGSSGHLPLARTVEEPLSLWHIPLGMVAGRLNVIVI